VPERIGALAVEPFLAFRLVIVDLALTPLLGRKTQTKQERNQGDCPGELHIAACSHSSAAMRGSRVAMNGCRAEGGQADGNVLRALGMRRAIPNPLAAMRDHGLSGGDVQDAVAMLDAQ
jgi:hypothetical protein